MKESSPSPLEWKQKTSAIRIRKRCCTIGSSMNRRCKYACKRWDSSRSPRSITTKRWWRLPQRSAGNSRSRVTNQSRAEAHSAQRPLGRDSYLGGLCGGVLVDKWRSTNGPSRTGVNDEGMTKLVWRENSFLSFGVSLRFGSCDLGFLAGHTSKYESQFTRRSELERVRQRLLASYGASRSIRHDSPSRV